MTTPETLYINDRRVVIYPSTPGALLVIGLPGRGSSPESFATALPFQSIPSRPCVAIVTGSPDWDLWPLRSYNAGGGVAGYASVRGIDDMLHVATVIGSLSLKYGTDGVLLAGHSNGGFLAQRFAATHGLACVTVGASLPFAMDVAPRARCLDIHGRGDALVRLSGEIRAGNWGSRQPAYDDARAMWGGRHTRILHRGGHDIPYALDDGRRPHVAAWEWYVGARGR